MMALSPAGSAAAAYPATPASAIGSVKHTKGAACFVLSPRLGCHASTPAQSGPELSPETREAAAS